MYLFTVVNSRRSITRILSECTAWIAAVYVSILLKYTVTAAVSLYDRYDIHTIMC